MHATLALVSSEVNEMVAYLKVLIAVPLELFPLNLNFPFVPPNGTPSHIPLGGIGFHSPLLTEYSNPEIV